MKKTWGGGRSLSLAVLEACADRTHQKYYLSERLTTGRRASIVVALHFKAYYLSERLTAGRRASIVVALHFQKTSYLTNVQN